MDIIIAVAFGLVASPLVIWAWRKLLPASADPAVLSVEAINRCRKVEFEAAVFMFVVLGLTWFIVGGDTPMNATSGLLFIVGAYSAYFFWLVVRVLLFEQQRTKFLVYVERRYRISSSSYLLMGLVSILVLLTVGAVGVARNLPL